MLLAPTSIGGYDTSYGFSPESKKRVEPVAEEALPDLTAEAEAAARADFGEEIEALSESAGYKSIAFHGQEAAAEAAELTMALELPDALCSAVHLAARLHDIGKAHEGFQSLIKGPPLSDEAYAKAPKGQWKRKYLVDGTEERKGFRHELASTLALFEILRRTAPKHAALLGPHAALVEAGLVESHAVDEIIESSPLTEQLANLTAEDFDLVTYLICAHHGKVRASLQATPHDQNFPLEEDDARGLPLRGVREGDVLPAVRVSLADGTQVVLPPLTLHLDPAVLGVSGRYGRSWRDRTEQLLDRHGPHRLAFYEMIVRVADVRASMRTTEEPT